MPHNFPKLPRSLSSLSPMSEQTKPNETVATVAAAQAKIERYQAVLDQYLALAGVRPYDPVVQGIHERMQPHKNTLTMAAYKVECAVRINAQKDADRVLLDQFTELVHRHGFKPIPPKELVKLHAAINEAMEMTYSHMVPGYVEKKQKLEQHPDADVLYAYVDMRRRRGFSVPLELSKVLKGWS